MSTLNIVGGLNGTGLGRRHQGQSGTIAWTNINFATSPPVGNTPIELMLRLLMSTGKQTNYSGVNYDVYEEGIGLGVPHDQIDITSFTAIQNQLDWDVNQQLFFMMTQPEPAREFIEQELCRPFGLYLATGNDGRIKCVRPRHPQKFYIGDANRRLKVTPAGSFSHTGTLDIGVYDAEELCAAVERAMTWTDPLENPQNGDTDYRLLCSYDTADHKFTVSLVSTIYGDDTPEDVPEYFNLELSSDNGWQSLGWTAGVTNVTTTTADSVQGAFTGQTLTKADLTAVRVIDNLEDRITSVVFAYDYDPDDRSFGNSRAFPDYIDPEVPPEAPAPDQEFTYLDDTHGRQDYFIPSRGLISVGASSASWVRHFKAPPSGCTPVVVLPDESVGLNADTWAKLHALSLLDRYKQPPIRFRARLKWKWNTLEIGDVLRVNYDIPGVFIDHERNTDTLDSRLFEIVSLRPNFDGTVDAEFLGHRYVGY